MIQAGHWNLRLIGLHNLVIEVDNLQQFNSQIGRAVLIMYDHDVGAGNYAWRAGQRTIGVNEVTCSGRQTVIITRGVAGDIEHRTDADVTEHFI